MRALLAVILLGTLVFLMVNNKCTLDAYPFKAKFSLSSGCLVETMPDEWLPVSELKGLKE